MAPTCESGPRGSCNADGRGGSILTSLSPITPRLRAMPARRRAWLPRGAGRYGRQGPRFRRRREGASMRLLLCGDVVGRSGRSVIVEHMPRLRRALALDFVVANGENAAPGFAITARIFDDLYAARVDGLPTGTQGSAQRVVVTSTA